VVEPKNLIKKLWQKHLEKLVAQRQRSFAVKVLGKIPSEPQRLLCASAEIGAKRKS
jgi:hypothetical protein